MRAFFTAPLTKEVLQTTETVFKLTKAGQETVLYSFSALHRDGHYPQAALIRDSSGNLYGTTLGGGIETKYCHVIENGCGVIFKLSSAGKETVLHRFAGYPIEGPPLSAICLETRWAISTAPRILVEQQKRGRCLSGRPSASEVSQPNELEPLTAKRGVNSFVGN